jgi:hypothetical protein
MSHGCINMRLADAAALFNWAAPSPYGLPAYGLAGTE